MWPACARKSRPLPSRRNTSSPSTGSATSSPVRVGAGIGAGYRRPRSSSCTVASAIRAIPRQLESRMQILITLVVTAVAVFQMSSFGGALKQSQPLLVKAVIDGDTIDVATVGRVRLLGITAPVIGRGTGTPAPFGREARDRLTSLVLNRWVRLEQEGVAIDVYNRHQAYVSTGDRQFVNPVLGRSGLALVST